MRSPARRWEQQVRRHFDFLLDAGFRFGGVEHGAWAMTATYLARSVGVEVTRSREFGRVDITLLRLDDGQPPGHQLWVTDEPVHRVLLDTVLEARGHAAATDLSGLDDEAQLERWAAIMQEVVPDFLRSDDAAMRDGEQVIRARLQEHPQQITVWLPTDSSEAAEREAVDEATRMAPPEVEVVVRRYRRG